MPFFPLFLLLRSEKHVCVRARVCKRETEMWREGGGARNYITAQALFLFSQKHYHNKKAENYFSDSK